MRPSFPSPNAQLRISNIMPPYAFPSCYIRPSLASWYIQAKEFSPGFIIAFCDFADRDDDGAWCFLIGA